MTEKDLIRSIKEFLKTKGERELFGLALANYKDKENLLNLNNFGFAFRALIDDQVLNKSAPNNEILKCLWFENKKPNDKDKIRYAISGGLSDKVLIDLDFDLEEYRDEEDFTQYNQVLNQLGIVGRKLDNLVHIKETESIYASDIEKENLYIDALKAIADWCELIQSVKESVAYKIENFVHSHISSNLNEYAQSACVFADYYETEIEDFKVNVLKISSDKIYLTIDCNLAAIDYKHDWVDKDYVKIGSQSGFLKVEATASVDDLSKIVLINPPLESHWHDDYEHDDYEHDAQWN